MKKFLWLLILCPVLTVPGFTPQISIVPADPAANEPFTIRLQIDRSGEPEFTLPAVSGLQVSRRINSTSRSISIINGKREVKNIYGINAVARKPGQYTIPAFDITVRGERARTRPVEFTVIDPAQSGNFGDPQSSRPQAKLRILPDRRIFTGEPVRAVISLWIPPGQQAQITGIRENGFGNAIFTPQGRDRSRWQQLGRRQGNIYEFSAMLQMQKSGKYEPSCDLYLQIATPREDDFFGGFGGFTTFANVREMLVTAKTAQALEVLPLPQAPANAIDTGLVGNWLLTMKLPPSAEFKTGEIAEITLDVSGSGSLELFHAPELQIPAARVYPPEVKAHAYGCTVKYIFVPLSAGAQKIQADFAVFNPEKGEYSVQKCTAEYMVVPGAAVSAAAPAVPSASSVPSVPAAVAPAVTAPSVPAVSVAAVPAAHQVKDFPLYPLSPQGAVTLPLWENYKLWIILFTTAGAVMLIISMLRSFLPRASQQEINLRKQREIFAGQLNSADDCAAFIRQHGLAEIAAALGLPAGATAGEIAARISDPELREFFHELDTAGFRPGTAFSGSREIKGKLLKLLKGTLLIAVLTFILPVQAEFRRGCAAFDSGRYAEAKEFFRQMINPDAPDPYSVYNFGCPLYMLGDYPRATLAFEQALLLAPGDARLKSAYRDALAKLPGAPEKSDGSFTEFVLSLRDNFRPDQYLLAASVLFAVLGAVALCRKLPGRKWSLFTLALLIAVMIIAAWSQSLHRYAPDRARIVAASAELHRLPADSGSVAGIIPGGSEVKIAERNGSWVRITMPGSPGGWVKSDEVREIFKHGVW